MTAPLPYARKPSIVDRVLNRLFPTAAYTGLLDPEQQQGLQRQGLLNVGLNLLQAGGPQTLQRGTLANIGASIQGVNFPQMAEQALALKAYQQDQQERQALTLVAGRHPAKPGENPEQTYDRIAAMVADLAALPGSEGLIGKLSQALAALRPRTERNDWMVQAGVGADGKPELYRINRLTGEIRTTGLGKPPTGTGQGGLTQQKASAGARTAIESIDHAESLYAHNANADVLPLGAALARGAKTSGGIMGVIAGAAEPLAQKSMTPSQQQFQADMQRMVHSMVGLLPGSRQSITLFNSLVNAYTPQPGEAPETRQAKRAARQRAKVWLKAVESGQQVELLPELSAAGVSPEEVSAGGGSATATPGSVTPTTPAYNPRWWRRSP